MGIDEYNSYEKIVDIYDNCVFYPYVPAPLHLEVTSYARFGILFYRPTILNKAFCAPNKIFEYGGFGIPMIGNDIPGLKNTIGNSNAGICTKLTEENIQKIVDVYTKREDVEHFSKLATKTEVEENGFTLSVSSYVAAEDTREEVDIVKLNEEIKEIVAREQVLRDEIDKIIKEIEV